MVSGFGLHLCFLFVVFCSCIDVVDVGTQGQYQMLDKGFIGLIFSVFHEDANKVKQLMRYLCVACGELTVSRF